MKDQTTGCEGFTRAGSCREESVLGGRALDGPWVPTGPRGRRGLRASVRRKTQVRAAALTLTLLLVTACGGSDQSGAAAEGDGQAPRGDVARVNAEIPDGLDPEEGITFTVEATGDLAFEHKGGAMCDVYQDELMVSFLQADDPFLGYELRVVGFSGAGSYDGTVRLERRGAESTGSAELEATIREGDLLPQLTGSFSGTASGALGQVSLKGVFQCGTDLGDPSAAVATPSGAWIEYAVSGDAAAELREPDVMVCSRGDGGVLLARSLGAWVVDIETDTSGWGDLTARFTLSAPGQLDELKSPGRDPRFRGSGRVVLEDKGTDRFGMPDVEGRFEAEGLTSDGGHHLNLSGAFRCGVM